MRLRQKSVAPPLAGDASAGGAAAGAAPAGVVVETWRNGLGDVTSPHPAEQDSCYHIAMKLKFTSYSLRTAYWYAVNIMKIVYLRRIVIRPKI